ncbi:BREX system ATP-binding domain-containing protein, partial [Nocardioides sp.]|uniref:BREX system ATP-binding domain-containing protein n=1 Tax=Nocardioides sp. TaxID=35761 RepID=UPI003563383C
MTPTDPHDLVPSPRTRSIVGDDPHAYVAEDRRRALAGGPAVDGRVTGATLFADVSGFTALTEALAGELGPQRGAEELTVVLERVFHALIQCLHDRGGSVLYFSGDAITAWLEGDDGWRATSCAMAMQEAMARVGTVTSPGGRAVTLGVKVAVAVGTARRFVAGDPAIQLIDVLAGALMDEVAAAEGAASPGEVVVTGAVLAALGDRARHLELRDVPAGQVARVGGLTELAAEQPLVHLDEQLPEEVVREWLLPAVYRRMQAGRGEFVADLRPAVPMFVQFGGIDFDVDEDAPEVLDTFLVRAQRVIDGYGGNLLQLTVGDKGAYLYGVFGSPTAHEDDAARACSAALDLLGLEGGGITGIRVGLAAGRLRSGTYGHRTRRTFCCLGDPVNLAARLMAKAPTGGVLVSDRVRAAAGDRFDFGEVQLLALKGKAAAAAASPLLGSHGLDLAAAHATALVGREEELATLRAGLDAVAGGQGRLVEVVGDIGTGKSRLLAEAVARARRDGLTVHVGVASSYGAVAAYEPWWDIWRAL